MVLDSPNLDASGSCSITGANKPIQGDVNVPTREYGGLVRVRLNNALRDREVIAALKAANGTMRQIVSKVARHFRTGNSVLIPCEPHVVELVSYSRFSQSPRRHKRQRPSYLKGGECNNLTSQVSARPTASTSHSWHPSTFHPSMLPSQAECSCTPNG